MFDVWATGIYNNLSVYLVLMYYRLYKILSHKKN